MMAYQQLRTDNSLQEIFAELMVGCAVAPAEQGPDMVRTAHALLSTASGQWQRHFADLPSATAIEAMIAVGAETAAALALLEGRGGYILSHGPSGSHMASVVFEDLTEEASATGATAALALIGALSATLAGPALDLGYGHAGMLNPTLRLN